MRVIRPMTATGRAVRFIALIIVIGLLAWITRHQPRTAPTSGGGLPASGMGSPRPGMRSLGY
ncbi:MULTISPECIES: hypothetical protein [unclassified Synechococcus]|uniref:hypothetical protein n=1 Tax=unclassified Synechococcus TaxID=2626047 RepID=UPI002000F7B9|nr:hypothetical protein [Synechococcus sp. A10-1-5-1]UPM51118.1 hypothetical protein MY494_04950 [Synechococcus sp. A10-1-5-1]